MNGNWKVTYRNALDGKRYDLIDAIDKATADELVARCSDKKAPQFYMPEAQVERMPEAA